MASLVLGAVGGLMFGPVGFMAGSLLGNLLFPGKQEGPRLTNLKLQGSSYGQMIPIGYGTDRLAGQVIWQTDLKEHKHTSGGKGGPEVTTFTYTASFAVKFAKGPAAGLLILWANGEIVYDTTGSTSVDNAAVPVTVYLGSETASPDPTMEAVLGVGNVPAFRDDVVLVFTDWDLGPYGNTLPNLSAEIFFSGSPIPWRVSSFTALAHQDGIDDRWSVGYDPLTKELIVANYGQVNVTYSESRFLVDGTPSGSPIVDAAIDPTPDGGLPRSDTAGVTGLNALYVFGHNDPGVREGQWYVGTSAVGFPIPSTGGPWGDCATAVNGKAVYQDGYIYGIWNNGAGPANGVARWPAPDGVPTGLSDASVTITPANGNTAASNMVLGTSSTGDIFIAVNDNSGGVAPEVYWYSADLATLKHHWIAATHGGTAPFIPSAAPDGIRGISNFVVYNGVICVNSSEPGPTHVATVWRINADFSFSKDPSVAPIINGTLSEGATDQFRFSNGLVLGKDGVISLDPQNLPITLASIVANISNRVGLSSSDYDVSELTQLVDGYLITTRADARTDIDPLRAAYFFDAVDDQGQAVFINRGSQPVVTIPDNDLAAQVRGDTPPPLIEHTRTQERDLPAQVSVKYLNSGAAFQEGTQQAIRQVTLSQAVSDVSLAIAMSDQKARQIANVLLYQTIVERDNLKILTSRKYLYLRPTDVISAGGWTMRLDSKKMTVAGLVEFEGKASIPALYVVALPSNATSGAQQPARGAIQPTQLVLLDVPLIQDTDASQGFYAAMAGTIDQTWRGATLFKSADGTTYAQIGAEGVADVIGTSSNALGDYLGGNMVDEINTVTVVIGPGGGSLASIDLLSMLNGGNVNYLGGEIFQNRDAVLTAPSTYKLSGLLRGRRGTEFAMHAHVSGEPFIVLPSLDVDSPFGELGQLRYYKGVTAGAALSSAVAQGFTNNGAALRAYAPVLFNGAADAGGNVVTSWTRRTRIGGAWSDFTDVPLSEASELYVLQVWDSTFSVCARVVTGLTSPAFTYTSAMWTADFGAAQLHYCLSVGQVGSFGLGVQSKVVIDGTGVSDTAPLNPVQPYNTAPPPTPVGPGCVVSGSTINSTMTWSNGFQVNSGPFGPNDVWVIKFTTPSSFGGNGGGSLSGTEFGGPTTGRDYTFSLGPCGPLLPGAFAHVGSTSIQQGFRFGFNPTPQTRPTLLPNTTYYLSVFTTQASPMLCVLGFTLDP